MRLLSDITQGSDQWHEVRAKHYCASEAPIIMGVSRHMKRTEFLMMKATGQQKEFSEWVTRNLLEKGHEAEAKARPLVEAIIGEDLYPVVGVSDCGKYLASFDGLTMDECTAFEHKLISDELIRQFNAAELDEEYVWQLEHQALVAGLERIVFVASDGTEDRLMHMIYIPSPERQKRLIAGWQQFEEDLKNYQHVEVIPAPAATSIVALPALSVQIVGEVRSSNLPAFQDAASRAIAAINTKLETDQDFADAEAAIKWCDTGEKDLDTVKRMAVGQMATIDDLFRTVDALSEQMRTKRLALQKLVKERKDAIRAEILQEGVKAFAAHIATLNERLGQSYMPDMRPDFAGAMKGKRTISSLRDAINVTLLNAKIDADEIAGKIGVNVRQLAEHPEHKFLFNDASTLVQMDPQAFAAVVENRILKHKQEQERKEAEARERIRKEEEAKAAAKAKAEADAIAEQAREKIRAEERAKAEAEAKKAPPPPEPPPSRHIKESWPAKAPAMPTRARAEPPPRPAPPRDEIVMLVVEKYLVSKSVAEKWMRELFAEVQA